MFPVIVDVWSDTTQNSKGTDPQVTFLGLDKSLATGCLVRATETATALSFSCQHPQPAHRSP